MSERDDRVYGVLFDLAAGSVDAMTEEIEGSASEGPVEVAPMVAALFKVAFHLGLRVGLSDVGREVYDSIEQRARDSDFSGVGMPQDAGLIAEFRDALTEPGPVH